MPTYQYACTSCSERREVVQRMTDAPLTTCEVCGGTLRKILYPVGVVFKGSGFYRTDSRGKPSTNGKQDGADKKDGSKDAAGAKDTSGSKDGSAKSGESGSGDTSSSSSSTKSGSSAKAASG